MAYSIMSAHASCFVGVAAVGRGKFQQQPPCTISRYCSMHVTLRAIVAFVAVARVAKRQLRMSIHVLAYVSVA